MVISGASTYQFGSEGAMFVRGGVLVGWVVVEVVVFVFVVEEELLLGTPSGKLFTI